MSMENQTIESAEQAVGAAVEVIQFAHRSLDIFTLAPPSTALFAASEVIDAFRQQAIHEHRLQCRLLLPAASSWRQSCAQLVQLLERLSTFQLRIPSIEDAGEQSESSYCFWIADQRAVLLLKDPVRLIGEFNADDPLTARKLNEFFTPLWEKSQSDIELRHLGI